MVMEAEEEEKAVNVPNYPLNVRGPGEQGLALEDWANPSSVTKVVSRIPAFSTVSTNGLSEETIME
jgi:hypothetical protein